VRALSLFVAVCGRVLRQQLREEVLQGEPARRLPQVLRDLLRRLPLRAVRDGRPQGRVPLLPRHDHRHRQPHQAQVPMTPPPRLAPPMIPQLSRRRRHRPAGWRNARIIGYIIHARTP
jgi:hypothetical protein